MPSDEYFLFLGVIGMAYATIYGVLFLMGVLYRIKAFLFGDRMYNAHYK